MSNSYHWHSSAAIATTSPESKTDSIMLVKWPKDEPIPYMCYKRANIIGEVRTYQL